MTEATPVGEDAIEDALLAAYPGAELIWCTPREGRTLQLAGYVAVRVEEPIAHWLIVSRGFTELREKEQHDPDVSGFGFELTCRVPASAELDCVWVLAWMQSIADRVAGSGSDLEPFQNMLATAPAKADEICALVFVEDVALRPGRSPNGGFYFLQMVGLTSSEYDVINTWDARAMVDLIRPRNPIFLTDPKRPSYLSDPVFAEQVTTGRDRDGSSVGVFAGVSIRWFQEANEIQILLTADAVACVKVAMRYRIPHGNQALLMSPPREVVRRDGDVAIRGWAVVLLPEDGPSRVEERGGTKAAVLRMGSGPELLQALAAEPGSYVVTGLAGVRFVVVTAERFAEANYPW